MVDKLTNWILSYNRSMPVDSQEMSMLELVSKLSGKNNEIVDDLNKKVEQGTDFTGTWHGLPIGASDLGLTADWNGAKDIFATLSERLTYDRARLKDLAINVKDLGAKGDYNGTTGSDNLSVFNQALNLVASGGEIIVPPGVYWLSDNWNIDKDNLSIKIMKGATIVTTTATTNGGTLSVIGYLGNGTAITPQRKNIKIYGGGTIKNSSPSTTENGIGVCRYSGVLIEDITIETSTRKAITVQYGVDNVIIRNCNIMQASINGITVETNCNNVLIEKNYISNISGNALHITGTCSNVVVSNNTIFNVTGIGAYAGTTDNVTFFNNKITQSQIGLSTLICSNVKIYDNEVVTTTSMGVKNTQASQSLLIRGNKLTGVVAQGFYCDSCTVKPIYTQNTITGATHTYATDTANMSGYTPIHTANKWTTGTSGLFNGWKPLFAVDIVDGTEYILENGKRITFGTIVPTTGTWAVGDKVYNTTPSAAGYEGWLCVSAGTPGTWKGFGLLQA